MAKRLIKPVGRTSKTAGVMPAQFGELTLTDDSAPLQLADKNTNGRKKENSQSAENSKGVRVGEDKDWNLQYGNDQTNLGMQNAIDKGTVNMQVNREGTVRVYQWGADAKNADGTIRDRRVDVDKYNNTHVGLHSHAQKLEVPADDTAKSVHGQILRK